MFICISSSEYKKPMLWFKNNNGHSNGGWSACGPISVACNDRTWAVMVLIDSTVVRYKRFDSWNGFISALKLSTIIFCILLYLSITLPLTPSRGCDCIGLGIRCQFLPLGFWVFEYLYTILYLWCWTLYVIRTAINTQAHSPNCTPIPVL